MHYGLRCKWSILTATAIVAIVGFTQLANSQQLPLLNTPPILYVPERNWRISDTEQVGQIIARIRAEDAENDELVFGLEPHFHSNYANPNDDDASELARDKLPFRIDPIAGVVYLNESLAGRGGENFFLYITVSDGQLTAKNEVFVNILNGKNIWQTNNRGLQSMTTAVRNISRFLPAFDRLPGVQSIRNQEPNSRPSNSIPSGFGINPLIFKPKRPSGDGGIGYPPELVSNQNQDSPIWSTHFTEGDTLMDKHTVRIPTEMETTSTRGPQLANRTKLKPIPGDAGDTSKSSERVLILGPNNNDNSDVGGENTTTLEAVFSPSIRTALIPVIIILCGLFVACVVVIAVLFRNRLCAVSKTLKKKSKEDMATKSNQSNLNSNLTEDSHNSMVMQHWNGPTAYGNRYVPWDHDQQFLQQSLQSTSAVHGVIQASNVYPPQTMSTSTTGPTPSDGVFGGTERGKYDSWEFPRHRLKFFNILGEGAFGQVWRCEAADINGVEGVTTVAVKTLKENAAEAEKRDLGSELEVMKSLEPHVNVVRFLGCCTDKDPIFVIIEYVNRGKLQTYLRNSRAERHYGNTHGKSNILTSGDLTSFMYQVAKGMEYLTSRGIIHRDLAARNILITDDHICKVADFGFARDVVTSKIYERKSEGKLPIRWMAIESLYDNIFSVKSDIWSFGILMWEIVTLGSTPYPGISAADVMRKVRDGYRLEKPEHCRRELYNIMYYCWSNDENDRPAFTEVVQMLDKLLHTEMDYIELERFPDHNYYNILNLSGEKL